MVKKTLSAPFFALLLAVIAPAGLRAAEPAEPSSAFGLTPAKPDTLLPEGQPGLPLIPDSLPQIDKKSKNKVGKTDEPEKPSKTTAAEDALRDLIKLRVAKTKAQSDPELQALWDTSYKARTDHEQREILTKYYTQLCAKIAKIDKTINPEVIESLKGRYLDSFNQSRVSPATPAPATPAPKAAPKTAPAR